MSNERTLKFVERVIRETLGSIALFEEGKSLPGFSRDIYCIAHVQGLNKSHGWEIEVAATNDEVRHITISNQYWREGYQATRLEDAVKSLLSLNLERISETVLLRTLKGEANGTPTRRTAKARIQKSSYCFEISYDLCSIGVGDEKLLREYLQLVKATCDLIDETLSCEDCCIIDSSDG